MIRGLTGEREEPAARTRRGVKLGANLHSSDGWRTAIDSSAPILLPRASTCEHSQQKGAFI